MFDFDFLQPETVAEASRMAAELGDGCRFIAGGTALVLALRQRMLAPTHLVSVERLQALRGITLDGAHTLRIGALTLHSELADSPLVRAHVPMLSGMAARLANPQVRNQGTLGGNLCYADPSTDPPACLLALGASVVLASQRGTRELALADFLVDYFTTALQPDELLQEVRVPVPPVDAQGQYTRHLRTAADHRPLASVAVLVRRSGTRCVQASIAVGAATPVPARLARAEAYLCERAVTAEVVAQAADMVAADITPMSDQRGDAQYRRAMVRVAARRTLAGLFGIDKEAP